MKALITTIAAAALLLAANSVSAQNEDLQQQVYDHWRGVLLAPPAHPSAGNPETPPVMPAAQRRLVLAQIADWASRAKTDLSGKRGESGIFFNLTYNLAPGIGMAALTTTDDYSGDSWPFAKEPPYYNPDKGDNAKLPDWFVDAVDKAVSSLSLPAGKAKAPAKHAGQATWQHLYEQTESDAFAWAGPAVRDGVARYRQAEGQSSVRFALNTDTTQDLHRWAQQQGLPVRLRLRRLPVAHAHSPIIIDGQTDMPVWLLNAEGLWPARLTAFSFGGDACDGSRWVEFTYSGSATPPVWAVLGFTNPALAEGVTVKRLPKREKLSWREAQLSEIAVTWPDDRLPALRIAARRFEWEERELEWTEPKSEYDGGYEDISRRVTGSAWGTQVFTLPPAGNQSSTNEDGLLLISGNGAPACPPP